MRSFGSDNIVVISAFFRMTEQNLELSKVAYSRNMDCMRPASDRGIIGSSWYDSDSSPLPWRTKPRSVIFSKLEVARLSFLDKCIRGV